MIAPIEKPFVQLSGEDGNAYGIIAKVRQALRQAAADKEYIDAYVARAMSGDYDNLLRVSMEVVDVG